jgi:hypothetical protein
MHVSTLIQRILVMALALSLTGCTSSAPQTARTGSQPKSWSASRPLTDPTSGPLPAAPEAGPAAVCPDPAPHPIGLSISETFEASYAQVIEWYCAGQSFEDILLALQTEELTGHPVAEIFALKEQMTWDEIWTELYTTP